MHQQPFNKPLIKLVREKKIKVKYPKGYQRWRKKFYTTLRENKGNVVSTLEKIHGKTPKSKGDT